MLLLSLFTDLNTPQLIAAWAGVALMAVGLVWILLVMIARGILSVRKGGGGGRELAAGIDDIFVKIAEFILKIGKKIFPEPAWGGLFFFAIGAAFLGASLAAAAASSGGGGSGSTTPTTTAVAKATATPNP